MTLKVGDRVVAEKGYFGGDRYTGKTGRVIGLDGSTGMFGACVEFDEQIGFSGVGMIYGGRSGFCAYGDPEFLRLISDEPNEPCIKITFDDLF